MNAPRPLQSPSAQMPGTLVAQLVVDGDVAARVGGDAGLVRPRSSVLGRRPDGEQQVGAVDLAAAPSSQSTPTATPLAVPGRRAMHSAPRRTSTPSRSRICLHRVGDVGVLAGDQPRRHLDHGDLGAEAAVHLRELQPDVAAADDDQVLGQASRAPSSRVGRGRAPRRRRAVGGTTARPPTLMKIRGASSSVVADRDGVRALEARVALDHRCSSSCPVSQRVDARRCDCARRPRPCAPSPPSCRRGRAPSMTTP